MSKRRPTKTGQNKNRIKAGQTRTDRTKADTRADRTRTDGGRDVFVLRPFEGLADEAEWVALRELVPAATAPLSLRAELAEKYPDRAVTLVTVLPMAWPALTRPGGQVLLAVQRSSQCGDLSRDLAAALVAALAVEPDTTAAPVTPPLVLGPGPRLQDLLNITNLDITVYNEFDFWRDETTSDAQVAAAMERANTSIFPTARMRAVRAAYWCRFPEKAHVRWVLPQAEDAALSALSRLSARGELTLGGGTRFAGMFRAHGLLAPVWDLPVEPEAEHWEQPVAELALRYAEALAVPDELDAAQRRARHGLLGRALTVR